MTALLLLLLVAGYQLSLRAWQSQPDARLTAIEAALAQQAASLAALTAKGGGGSGSVAPPQVAHLRPSILADWAESDFAQASHAAAAWGAAPTDTWAALDFPGPNKQLPIFNYAPPLARSCERRRYGATGDGGKFLCSLAALKPGCVIYSLGSRNQFDFEAAMLAETPCAIHTFDCTVDGSTKPADARVIFHRQCLGDGATAALLNARQPAGTPALTAADFFTLAELAASNGHSHIDVLKMDVEAGEYPIFASLAATPREADHLLPDQISFELHVARPPWFECEPQCDFWRLWSDALDLGYAIVSREDNALCDSCVEYTLARVSRSLPRRRYPPKAPAAALVPPPPLGA